MSDKEKADATQEAAQTAEGADQLAVQAEQDMDDGFAAGAALQADGALNLEAPPERKPSPARQAAAAAAPREEASGKFVPKDAAGKPGVVVPEPKVEPEPEPDEKTALQLAEEAAADEKPPVQAQAPVAEPQKNVLDVLPVQYGWAKEICSNGKLDDFLRTQPKAVQKAADSGDPDDAMYVLDLYKKAQEPAVAAPTASDMKSFLAEYGHVEFTAPDGTKKTLDAISKEYGNQELFEAFGAIIRSMKTQPAAKTDDKLQQRLDAIEADRASEKTVQKFWETVLDEHSDAKKLVNSGAIEKWVGENEAENPFLRTLLKKSADPDKAIKLLDAYKEDMASRAGEPARAKASARHQGAVGLHSESLRPTKNVPKKKQGEESADDFDKGFDEGVAKK